jgi:hypothetical protein
VVPAAIAVDERGNAVVVGIEQDRPLQQARRVWATRFQASGAWGRAEELHSLTSDASRPALAMTPGGTAVTLWSQHEEAALRVLAARFVPGAGWEVPVRVASAVQEPFSPRCGEPELALDRTGAALAVWCAPEGPRAIVRASRLE